MSNIPKPDSVPDYEERRALQGVVDGRRVDTSALKDYAFRRAVQAVSEGSPIPELDSIKSYESRRILQYIKNNGV